MIKEVYKTNTIDETLDILETKENTMIISGGTDLIVQMRNDRLNKEILVDISDVSRLKEIKEYNDVIKIGAGVTFNQIILNDIFEKNLKGIKKAASLVGSPQIRSRGTVGGNICNNSPSADLIPPLLALDTKIIIQSKYRTKKMLLKDFLLDKNKVNIKEDELLTSIEIRKNKKNEHLAFYKLGFRNSLSISKISASVLLGIENNKFKNVKIALGAISSTSIRVEKVEDYLIGKEVNEANINEALNILQSIISINLGKRESSDFKSYAVKGIVENAMNECINEILRG